MTENPMGSSKWIRTFVLHEYFINKQYCGCAIHTIIDLSIQTEIHTNIFGCASYTDNFDYGLSDVYMDLCC